MDTILVSYSSEDLNFGDWEHKFWKSCPSIEINAYWSGAPAENARRSEVRLAWTDNALCVRFTGNQEEPLNINSSIDLTRKNKKLWERDVFEIFIAPDAENVRNYYEFEVAPTGEWLDLKMQILPDGERQPDFGYDSQMKVSARVSNGKVQAFMRIGWDALGEKPDADALWRGNFFRCVGSGKTRGYLAWQSTGTAEPDFHVPERFGRFKFVK